MTLHDPTEVLSAVLDGEDVSPTELAKVLAGPDAADTLVDFVSLRLAVLDDLERTGGAPAPVASGTERPRRGRSLQVAVQFAAAVLLVAVTVTVTRWVGTPVMAPAPESAEQAERPNALPDEPAKVVPAGWQWGKTPEDTKPEHDERWL